MRRANNLEWIGNTNAVPEDARGQADYMLFAFHDDVLLPGYVAHLAARFAARRDAVSAVSDAELLFEDQAPQPTAFPRLERLTSARAHNTIMARMPANWYLPAHGMFRAGTAQTIRGLKRSHRGEVMANWP